MKITSERIVCEICDKELVELEAQPISVIVGEMEYFNFHLCMDHWVPLCQRLQEIQKLKFCYFCGHNFNNDDEKTRDHVPPKAIFLTSDRKNPCSEQKKLCYFRNRCILRQKNNAIHPDARGKAGKGRARIPR